MYNNCNLLKNFSYFHTRVNAEAYKFFFIHFEYKNICFYTHRPWDHPWDDGRIHFAKMFVMFVQEEVSKTPQSIHILSQY